MESQPEATPRTPATSFGSNEIALGVTAAAIALADGLDANEIDIMAAAFTQLGDTLATIYAVRRGNTANKP